MVGGHYGRNPALLMPKMESTSDTPGGPNLMCCCARPAGFRRGSIAGPASPSTGSVLTDFASLVFF
jgi:hypothetical protein